MKQIIQTAIEWCDAGQSVAVATVMETWGSAPRRAGSQMLISDAGDIAGSVSGGCVEGAVVTDAVDVIASGQPRILEFDVDDGTAFAAGLTCGGRISVLVEPIGGDQGIPMAMMRELAATPQALAYLVDIKNWQRRLVRRAEAHTVPGLSSRFNSDRSGMDANELTVIFNLPLRLIVVGAVHIAQSLLPMARLAGYDVTLVDPRQAFASATRFPGEAIISDWPDAALLALALDRRTAVVTLTHDPKLDDPAILTALQSKVFYIGSLGSRKSHAKRLARLRELGLGETDLARINGPVGLDIGAETPAEIAVAIVAELTATLRGDPA